MKKSCSSSFPSPGAPYYRERRLGNQKGWSSERVSKGSSSSISRRHTMGGLTPLCGGRTMPSKWDEAERWISSPVSAYAESRSSHAQLQRRPKSISGPIVPPAVSAFYSPVLPLRQGLLVRNLMVGSPFSTGVLAPLAVSLHHCDSHDSTSFDYDMMDNGMQFSSPVLNDTAVLLSSMPSALSCSPLPCHRSSSPISQDEKHDGKMNEKNVTSNFSRCDKGTQMSPAETENDAHSSPKSSATSVVDQQECHSPKLEVRDVQVDSQATIIRWSKRHATKLTKKDSLHSKASREISAEAQASCWDVEESNMDTSKLQREEAKIIAWENLQKAKAETAIRKLEMKLEKKRSSSMDKILNKLRRAQLKAENMKNAIPVEQGHQVSKCRVFSFSKYAQIWSPSSCFGSHDQ
ncbi:Remorin 4.1, partial [Mucuna pruriens]